MGGWLWVVLECTGLKQCTAGPTPSTLPAPPIPPPAACRPLVFDLALQVDPSSLAADGSQGWRILHVYGSPNPNDTALSGDGTIMRVGVKGRWGRRAGMACCLPADLHPLPPAPAPAHTR